MNPPLRILMVENDGNDRAIVERFLRRQGLDLVAGAAASERELRAALEARWDVALLDFSLPGLDAERAIEVIEQVAPGLPYIIVSGKLPFLEVPSRLLLRIDAGEVDSVAKGNLAPLPDCLRRRVPRLGSSTSLPAEGKP